jgi:hypothetical protein
MSDMEWSLHLNTSLAPHNFGRGMTAARRTPMFYANVMQLSPGQLDRHEKPAVVREPAEQAPHIAQWLRAQQRVRASPYP